MAVLSVQALTDTLNDFAFQSIEATIVLGNDQNVLPLPAVAFNGLGIGLHAA